MQVVTGRILILKDFVRFSLIFPLLYFFTKCEVAASFSVKKPFLQKYIQNQHFLIGIENRRDAHSNRFDLKIILYFDECDFSWTAGQKKIILK